MAHSQDWHSSIGLDLLTPLLNICPQSVYCYRLLAFKFNLFLARRRSQTGAHAARGARAAWDRQSSCQVLEEFLLNSCPSVIGLPTGCQRYPCNAGEERAPTFSSLRCQSSIEASSSASASSCLKRLSREKTVERADFK